MTGPQTYKLLAGRTIELSPLPYLDAIAALVPTADRISNYRRIQVGAKSQGCTGMKQ